MHDEHFNCRCIIPGDSSGNWSFRSSSAIAAMRSSPEPFNHGSGTSLSRCYRRPSRTGSSTPSDALQVQLDSRTIVESTTYLTEDGHMLTGTLGSSLFAMVTGNERCHGQVCRTVFEDMQQVRLVTFPAKHESRDSISIR